MYSAVNNKINQLVGVTKPLNKNTMKTNLSVNAQTFLDNFKEYVKNTGHKIGSILTTVNNENYKAYKELIGAGLIKEVAYYRGFSDYQLTN